MAKFYGIVGYVETKETSPGIWENVVIEKQYHSGEVLKNTRRWQTSEKLNDNLVINNTISIIADSFAYDNLYSIKYIKWMGVSWKVTNVEIQRPRLLLTLGDIYNGN